VATTSPPPLDSSTVDSDDSISCQNACIRAPRCEGSLVTEADCNALCEAGDDPETYACCIQYAAACADVKACIEGTNRVCDPAGEPWIPLELFDPCICGDSQIPKTHECKDTAPDQPCPLNSVCLKPSNSSSPPFCAIECTLQAEVCLDRESPLSCEETPKTWYCK